MSALAVSFACRLTRTRESLSVEYAVTNTGKSRIGLFNQITRFHIDGTFDVSCNTVYIELDGSSLVAGKLALPVPPGLRMNSYAPPYTSLVLPGQTFREQVQIAIPVRVMQPFRRAMLSGQVVPDKPTEATRLHFQIGAFGLQDDVQLVAENPAWPALLQAFPPGVAVARQQVLTQDMPLDPPVRVLDYRAVPWP